MGRKRIIDEFTEVKSQQRRYQLRNPEKEAERRKAYRQSEAGKAVIRGINQRQWAKRKAVDNSANNVLDKSA